MKNNCSKQSSDIIKWLEKFNNPGEYREYASSMHIGVSTTFCHATSKIMEKFGITFSEACQVLVNEGYLYWAENTPVYNMKGDKLWMGDESIASREASSKESSIEDIEPSIYTDEVIRCNFFTLVVRNQALEDKYKGGLKSYVSNNSCIYNSHICVQTFMDGNEIPMDDLETSGLLPDEDWIIFNAGVSCLFQPDYDEVHFKVNWLKGYCLNRLPFVHYEVSSKD